jgi:hypothetical protein
MVTDEVIALVAEDLARSGLTLEDVGGEATCRLNMRQRLGFEKRIPAKGGYAIPYFGFDGNPILDSGSPFERVRLVGIEEGSEIGKYLAPIGSHAHLYIPRQLKDALANSVVGPTLVITEGEKKAVKDCLSNIPTVALPGITNYKSRTDKDDLHEEIADLLKSLYEQALIDSVAVVFDSDGYPLKTAELPSDEEEKQKYTRIKGGMYVRNRDVFNHAFKLAALIRQTIAGLRVGYGWCVPAFSTAPGPKGGKLKIVEKVGLDDAIVAGRTSEVVGWIEDIASRAQAGYGKGGYVPLGTMPDGLTAVAWSIPQGKIIRVGVGNLGNSGVLAAICGRGWLEQKFTKFTKDGAEIDTKTAAMVISDACSAKGDFRDEERIFGTGAWLADGGKTVVVNTHNAVYMGNGETIDRFDETRKEIYLGNGSMTPPDFCEVSDADYERVCGKIDDDLETWTWDDPIMGPMLVMGWMVMSVFLGMVERRPHTWIIGPRGSGKSRLLSYIRSVLAGYVKHTDMGASVTEAGIRQSLQESCFPFILDELEKENTDNGHKLSTAIDQVLKIMRAAYSASSKVIKGTADQRGIEFRIQTSVMAASIAEPALEPADRTRVVLVKLKPRQGAGGRPPKNLSREEAATFFWGTIQRWDRFQRIYNVVMDHWDALAGPLISGDGDGREAETFGTILAASMLLIQEIQTDEHILKILTQMLTNIKAQLEDVREGTAEHDIILGTILTQNVTVEYHETDDEGRDRINRETRAVGQLVYNRLANRWQSSDEERALAQIGLRVLDKDGQQYLAVAVRHSGLAALLRGTRYNKDGAWAGGLKDVPGAICKHSTRISGRKENCHLIPASELRLQSDDPAGKPTVQAVPHAFGTRTIN